VYIDIYLLWRPTILTVILILIPDLRLHRRYEICPFVCTSGLLVCLAPGVLTANGVV